MLYTAGLKEKRSGKLISKRLSDVSCKSEIKLLNMEGSGKEWPHLEQEGRSGKELPHVSM